MITQLTNNGGNATLTLVGRLDTVAAQELNAELQPLLAKQDSIESLVVDAEGLEYISSSGLRILLTLTKQYKDFRIISKFNSVVFVNAGDGGKSVIVDIVLA